MSAVQIQGNASGTGTLTIAAPNTNTNRTLTLPDGTGTFSVAGVNSNIVAGTAVASTSGTSIDFTSIPSWVKRITVMFNGVSGSGTSNQIIQTGSGSIDATSYTGALSFLTTSTMSTAAYGTTGYAVVSNISGAQTVSGSITLFNVSGNIWVLSSVLANAQGNTYVGGGVKTTSGTLDRVRITTVNGTDTFDAGSINILYE
jgi:hypothetical protein